MASAPPSRCPSQRETVGMSTPLSMQEVYDLAGVSGKSVKDHPEAAAIKSVCPVSGLYGYFGMMRESA